MPKKLSRNVWQRLDDAIHETNVETTQTRFSKWWLYIILLLIAGCGIGIAIGYFLS